MVCIQDAIVDKSRNAATFLRYASFLAGKVVHCCAESDVEQPDTQNWPRPAPTGSDRPRPASTSPDRPCVGFQDVQVDAVLMLDKAYDWLQRTLFRKRHVSSFK